MDYQEAIENHIKECRHRIDVIRNHMNTNGDADKCACNKNIEVLEISISAMQELQQYKQIGTLEEVREAVEKQHPKKPILKNGKSGMFVDYADGHGEYKVTKWQDWCCPACGWFVGQRYNASQSRSHDQRKSNYCNECGTK